MKNIIRFFTKQKTQQTNRTRQLTKQRQSKQYICNFADDYYNDQRCVTTD